MLASRLSLLPLVFVPLLAGRPERAGSLPAEKYEIDADHSEIGFRIRFMGLTNVRGRFTRFGGTVMYAEADLTRSTITLLIDAKSIDTGLEMRDRDLQGQPFFAADSFPFIRFQSTRVTSDRGGFVLHGPLTMRGVTREVSIPFVSAHARMKDAWGHTRLGFTGSLKLNRQDYGVTGASFWSQFFDAARMTLADTVEIDLSIQLIARDYRSFSFGAPEGKRSLGEALFQTFQERGLEAALVRRNVLLRDSAEMYPAGEGQLNLLGYKLLSLGQVEAAVTFLRLNVQAFPRSANAYDSLGEAYLRKGDDSGALAAYRRALELDPLNTAAMEVVRWLSPAPR